MLLKGDEMKFMHTIILALCAANLVGSTVEEDAFLQDLMLIYESASENSDCVEDVEEGRILGRQNFTTSSELFGYQFPSNTPYARWSVESREAAFKSAVSRLSRKSIQQMTEDEISGVDSAFMFCLAMHYTNCLEEACAVVCRTNSPARWSAHDYLFDLAIPSFEMNAIALSISMNAVDYTKSERRKYVGGYLTRLLSSSVADEVRQDAASRFYSTRSIHELYYELNPLLISADSNYATSTNQLSFALEALSLQNIEGRRKIYFQSITNRLGRTLAPQVD